MFEISPRDTTFFSFSDGEAIASKVYWLRYTFQFVAFLHITLGKNLPTLVPIGAKVLSENPKMEKPTLTMTIKNS